MKLSERIDALQKLRQLFLKPDEELIALIESAYHHNRWFDPKETLFSLKAIAEQYLAADKIQLWLQDYKIEEYKSNDKILGIVMAGNLPLVGFHDFLSGLMSGYRMKLKLSEKDPVLWPYIIKHLPDTISDRIELTYGLLRGFDAIIATGSNNTVRYFEHYFGKYPNIIRRHRNAVAVLDASESDEDLLKLGEDIFRFYGLGCRNVSKLYLPEGYDIVKLLDVLQAFDYVMQNDKYKNNYDYNRTLLLLNNTHHFASDSLILREDERISSRIASVHYSYYTDPESVANELTNHEDQIQCMIGKGKINREMIPFGEAQKPGLRDYADKIDTMKFLNEEVA